MKTHIRKSPLTPKEVASDFRLQTTNSDHACPAGPKFMGS